MHTVHAPKHSIRYAHMINYTNAVVLQGSQKLFGFGQADICGNEDDPTLVCEAHSACVACSY